MYSNSDTYFAEDYSDAKSFYIYGRWCPRRNLQATRLYRYLLGNGLVHVTDPTKADLVVIFTCGSLSSHENVSLLTIEKTLKNRQTKTIITGCLPKIDPERIKKYDGALIITPEKLDIIDRIIQAKIPYKNFQNNGAIEGIHALYNGNFFQRLSISKISNLPSLFKRFFERPEDFVSARDLFDARTTYKLEIAEGCLSNCSYCAIKLAMGKFHSFSEEQILEDFRLGLKHGYSDFVLIAADIGCYGLDINTNLPNLLEKLFAEEANYKLLLWDLNARWFIHNYNDLSKVIKANSEKISRIVIPIESGSNRILKLMNRCYDIDELKPLIKNLQKSIPNLKIDTQIIVGFPGETDEDFAESLQLVKEIHFSEVVVFKYDDRPNTKASNLPYKVASKVIEKRAKILANEFGSNIVN